MFCPCMNRGGGGGERTESEIITANTSDNWNMPGKGPRSPNPVWERGQGGIRHRLSSSAQSVGKATFKRPVCTESLPRRKTQHCAISFRLTSSVFRKNSFTTNVASTSLGKSRFLQPGFHSLFLV